MLDEFDDDPDAEFPAPGLPPAPSVTPGSAPPPPDSAVQETTEGDGCLLLLLAGAVLALLGLVVVALLVVVGIGFFGTDDGTDAQVLQDVFVETGIASASTDAVHPPQRDIRLGLCEGDGNGGVRAGGTITNWTGSAADYRIDVSFRSTGPGSAGEEFAARVVELQRVPERSTANWEATVEDPPEGPFACRVVAVNRWRTGTGPIS